jgi:uncharacterized membrane protein
MRIAVVHPGISPSLIILSLSMGEFQLLKTP